ncbi:MAG: hypothetical protein RB296_03080 [Acidobacteriota bacterium]|jgi:hypothetical protein|nr:hypothetical protein [Acidobacteriota bacterium]
MISSSRKILPWIPALAGLASLAIHARYLSLPALLALTLSLFTVALRHPQRHKAITYSWLCGALLVWPARLTYWDAVEFGRRLSLLTWIMALALILTLLMRNQSSRRIVVAFNRISMRRRLVLLFLAAWVLLAAGAAGMTLAGVPLLGDEPHYLVIAQSLLEDGDLNVANQYAQRQYRRYLPDSTMGIHGYFGWRDARFQERSFPNDLPPPQGAHIYSIHLPGVAVTMLPVMIVPLPPVWWTFLLRVWLGLSGAAVVVMAYLFGLRLSRRRHFALQLSLVALFTPPLFFHAIHAYPETQVLFLLLLALYLLLYGRNRSRATWFAGLLLGLLFFWGVKYAIFIWAFVAGFSVFFLKRRRFGELLRLWVFPLLFQALLLGYLYHAYHNFSVMSVYLNHTQKMHFSRVVFQEIPHQVRIDTLLDYFLDQRDGLLPYAPVFFLAFPGLWLALRHWRRYRYHLLLSVPAAAFVFSYAFLTHRGGQCPQARPLIPVIWALLLFAWVYLREGRNQWLRRGWRWLPLYAAGVTVFQVIYPWTLYQPTTHNVPIRAGLMFQMLSPLGIRLDHGLPSFAKMPGNWDWWPNPLWLAVLLLLFAWALFPQRLKRPPGRVVLGIAVATGLVLSVILPRVPDFNPTLVTAAGGMPYRLMAVSNHPRRVDQRVFNLEAGQAYSFTLATFLPAETMEVQWDGAGPPPFRLKLFDTPAAPATESGWQLGEPVFRRFRNRFYYRLHLVPRERQGLDGTMKIRLSRR